MQMQMRVLGVDYGERRMGLAVSDPEGKIASGIGTVQIKGMRNAAEQIILAVNERGAGCIVLGYPRNLSGTESPMSERVLKLKLLLEQNLPREIGIELFDERLSTAYAHQLMNITDTRGRRRKENIDTLAAQIILQDYLDRGAHTE